MKKKIIGILICMILSAASVLPVAVGFDEKNNTTTETIDPVPILYFKKPPIINFGNIPLILENSIQKPRVRNILIAGFGVGWSWGGMILTRKQK